ncbi:MAG: KH domain-containing protein [Firmicutes bacterium]|nr:KH domain-containing protein [Bacillota bacterium]
MKEVVKYIAEALCDYPEEVEVTTETDRGAEIIKISVAKDDMGKVIGRNGKIATSIRTIVKSLSNKQHKKVIVKIEEKND